MLSLTGLSKSLEMLISKKFKMKHKVLGTQLLYCMKKFRTMTARVKGKKFSHISLEKENVINNSEFTKCSPCQQAGRAPCGPPGPGPCAPMALSPGAAVAAPSQSDASLREVRARLIKRNLKTKHKLSTLFSAFLKAYLLTRGIFKVFYVWSKHRLTHLQLKQYHDAREGGISINLMSMSTLFQRDRVHNSCSETQILCYTIFIKPINIVESYFCDYVGVTKVVWQSNVVLNKA